MKKSFPPVKRFKRAGALGFACLAILIVLLVLVAACSSGQGIGSGSPATPVKPATPTPTMPVTPTPPIPQIVIDLSTAHGYDPHRGPVDPATRFSAGSTIYAVFQEQLDLLPLASRGCLKGVLQGDNVFAAAAPTAIPPYPQAVTGGWAYLPFQPGPPAASLMVTITISWSSALSCTDPQAVWHMQAQASVTLG